MKLLYLYSDRLPYLRLAEETCLTRRRAAALYLHAASRPAYFFCALASLGVAALLLVYAYRASGAALSLPPSEQSVPLTEESRTPRGYPRRYVTHVVKAGDTYFILSQHYYGGLMSLFTRHHGRDREAWKVIQDENKRADQPPFAPKAIPVAIELKIPLP